MVAAMRRRPSNGPASAGPLRGQRFSCGSSVEEERVGEQCAAHCSWRWIRNAGQRQPLQAWVSASAVIAEAVLRDEQRAGQRLGNRPRGGLVAPAWVANPGACCRLRCFVGGQFRSTRAACAARRWRLTAAAAGGREQAVPLRVISPPNSAPRRGGRRQRMRDARGGAGGDAAQLAGLDELHHRRRATEAASRRPASRSVSGRCRGRARGP